jgi:ABC-type transporter Mla subunit MlaD
LSSQGVVGVSFLDIRVDGDGKTKDKMIVKRENYLPSKPSDMELLTKNAKNIISDLQVIVKKSDLVLSEKNIKNIEKSIENFAQTSIYLNSKKHNIDRLFEDSNSAIRDFSHSMQSANRLVEESQGAVLETKELIKDGRLFISNQSFAMQKIENDTGDIIGEVKALTKDSREFVEELKKAPINFIFGGAQQKIGPGE